MFNDYKLQQHFSSIIHTLDAAYLVVPDKRLALEENVRPGLVLDGVDVLAHSANQASTQPRGEVKLVHGIFWHIHSGGGRLWCLAHTVALPTVTGHLQKLMLSLLGGNKYGLLKMLKLRLFLGFIFYNKLL